MSRAFVKEPDGDQAVSDLPERPISPHPNFVTQRGQRLIEDMLGKLEHERVTAKSSGDAELLARVQRDLRYWQQRKFSAQVVVPETSPTQVRFGVTVILNDAGAERRFTLVGEDEASPAEGLISWTSPVGQALLGREVGEEASLQGRRMEIVRLDIVTDEK